MKSEYKIIIISIFVALFLWIADALVDYMNFSYGSFLSALILDKKEVFFRLLASFFFITCGILVAKAYSKQEHSEEELLKTRNYLQTIIETEPECVKLLARDGTLLKMNRAGLEMIEADSIDQVKGESVYTLISPEYRQSFEALTGKTFEGTSGTKEFEMVGLKGKRLWLETHAVPIRDAKGEIFASLGITRDITQRKTAEEKLKLFSQAIEEATDGIQITNLDGYIIYSNNAVEEMYGFRSDELIGKHVNELNADKEFADKVILPSMRETGRWNGELTVRHQDGKTFPIWLTTALIKNDIGRPIAMMGIIRDISRRKQAEEEIKRLNQELQHRASQLEQSYKDLESFTYTASHDLREPLMVIEWFCGNLLKKYGDGLDDDGRETITVIKEKAKQMTQLINDLLSFSRISTKEVIKSAVDIQALARNLFAEMKATNGNGDRDIRFEVKEVPPTAWGDPSMIRQVLTNLLSNALKYTHGRATAIIEIGGAKQQGKNIYYVKDNGIGFDSEDSDRLFGLFQRLQRSQEFEGTGIGLVVAKRIIEKHGGCIWAEGRVGEGATFYFSLPTEPTAPISGSTPAMWQ